MFDNSPLPNRAVYEIMWKKTVEPGRPQMKIWRISIAYVTSYISCLSCFFSCDLCETENVRRAHCFRRGLSFTFLITSTVHIIREYSQYSLNAVTILFCFSRGMTVTFRLSYVCPASPFLTSSYTYIENVHIHSCTSLLHGEILGLLYLIR
jgi:hypothetical protein